jgi:hypothetical protein
MLQVPISLPRPLKFLGPTQRTSLEPTLHIEANASFNDLEKRKGRNDPDQKRKVPKCSLLKFLEAKAQKRSLQSPRGNN